MSLNKALSSWVYHCLFEVFVWAALDFYCLETSSLLFIVVWLITARAPRRFNGCSDQVAPITPRP